MFLADFVLAAGEVLVAGEIGRSTSSRVI